MVAASAWPRSALRRRNGRRVFSQGATNLKVRRSHLTLQPSGCVGEDMAGKAASHAAAAGFRELAPESFRCRVASKGEHLALQIHYSGEYDEVRVG